MPDPNGYNYQSSAVADPPVPFSANYAAAGAASLAANPGFAVLPPNKVFRGTVTITLCIATAAAASTYASLSVFMVVSGGAGNPAVGSRLAQCEVVASASSATAGGNSASNTVAMPLTILTGNSNYGINIPINQDNGAGAYQSIRVTMIGVLTNN